MIHYQKEEQPALMFPVCGTKDYQITTHDPNEVTCVVCIAWLLRESTY